MKYNEDPYSEIEETLASGGAPKKAFSSRSRSAFGYYGSKQRLSSQILAHLPPHNCWVELFCGSAAMTMAKKPAKIEIINDLDHEIVNVFLQLRTRPKDLIQAIKLTPYAKEEFRIAMSNDKRKISDLERARQFLTKAMMAVNGILGKSKGGFSFSNSYSRNETEARISRWNNYPERLEAVVDRLRNVRIENRDALELFQEFSCRPATLVYIDPPYLMKRSAGYSVDTNDENFHVNLLRQANASKCMVVISGYNSDVYNRLLKKKDGWTKINLDTHTKSTSGVNLKRNELLWLNASACWARESGRVPIKLSKIEEQYKKVNPIRRNFSIHRYRSRKQDK